MPLRAFLAGQPKPMQDLLELVRGFLHDTAPGLREAIKWGVPTFMAQRNLFYLNPRTTPSGPQVALGFCEGAAMLEYRGVFDEVKAQVALVHVRGPEDLQRPGLREAIRDAAGLPPQRRAARTKASEALSELRRP